MMAASNLQSLISNLPENFQFSQGSLQAYADCPRLFQLRYIERLAWPAPEAEPVLENERYLRLGSDFHRLVQQHFLGVPAKRLTKLANRDEMLSQWWCNFTENGPDLSGYAQFNEITLSAAVGGNRLVAMYDLIGVERGEGKAKSKESEKNRRIVIYDWKTSRKLPKREWQERKLQTKVYPYVLVKAGSHLNNGSPIEPEQIEMAYWFSSFPTAAMEFSYDQAKFEEAEKYISGLIDEIRNIGEEEAPKTENEKRCKFCVYRSLCNRGVAAGNIDEFEQDFDEIDDFEIELDFEQIAEIEF